MLERGAGTYESTLDLSYADELILFLRITAVGGDTKTLNVKFQVADPDGIWYDHTTFAQATAIGTQSRSVAVFGGRTKIVAVVGGTETPTFTFAVTAVAKTR